MAELGRPRSAAGPIGASVVGCIGIRTAVRLRTGEDIVLVGRIADALSHLTFFGERGGLGNAVAQAGDFKRVAMQLGHVGGDDLALGVGPRTSPDAITRVYRART